MHVLHGGLHELLHLELVGRQAGLVAGLVGVLVVHVVLVGLHVLHVGQV